MAIGLENLIIEKVAIHQIFKRESKEIIVPPVYNNECSEMDLKAKDALQKRLTSSLGSKSHSLKMQIEDDGEESVYSYITKFWLTEESDTQFIELSKVLTKRLVEAQNNRIFPGGVIVILKGTMTEYNKDYIAIIKAEIQDGFNIAEEEGKNVFKYISNLLLTPQQKLQKIGFFVNNAVKGRPIEKKDVSSYIFDSNTDKSVAESKATYFYSQFLGLNFRQDGDVITNKFYMSTRAFINTNIKFKTEDKLRLQSSLYSYLIFDNSPNINPSDFATTNIDDGQLIDEYFKYLEAWEVPLNNTRKDITMIGNSIITRKLAFENSIKLEAPVDEFLQNVNIIEDEEGNTIIKIKGKYINEK